ncbi:MAG: penicillin-binding protein 2 [Ignavibacteria bacterium]
MNNGIKHIIFYAVTIVTGLVLIFRLIELQVINQKEYGKESEKNSIKKIIETPARGIIFDRNGKVMVDNKPSYTITVTPSQFDKSQIEELAKLINESPDDILETISSVKGTNRYNPVNIKRDVDFKTVAYIEENKDKLKGVSYVVESLRYYPIKFRGSHIFGYLGEITQKQLESQDDGYYRMGDLIGITGLEKQYEKYLRGEKGVKLIVVDVNGKEVGPYNNGLNDEKSKNGYDLYTTIDPELQEYAEKLLGKRRGAIVAMDPRNGEVLCLVSKPDFDLSIFSGTPDKKEISKLFNDEGKPVFNRAIQSKYPPGSTWKMMMGMIALVSGKITTSSTIYCGGSFQYGNRVYEDHGAYGAINLTRAIEVSSNVFFYKLGLMVGLDNFHYYSKLFGFGTKTGIDLPGETSGLLPSVEYYNKIFGVNKWSPAVLVNLGIGQGELGVSPIQLVAYVSAMCKDGLYSQPHLVRKIVNPLTGETVVPEFRQYRIEFPQKYYDAIKKGMYLVVNGSGTAKNIKSSEFVLAGKTGTAQNPNGNNHSWFVGYAPYDDPQIAVCVLGENAGWGNQFAAPLAAAIMVRYLSNNSLDVYNENITVQVRD